MVPLGKYQLAAVVLWQGASDQPDDPWTAWLRATPPPETVTVWDSHDPEDRDGMDGVATAWAGTATAVCTVAPASLTAVMEAATERPVVLVRMRKPGEMPDPVDWPVQYQADDSAFGALDERTRHRRRRGGRRRTPHAGGDGHAGHHEHDHGEHRPSALVAVMGRAHVSPGGAPAARRALACRGRPRRATARTTQAASSSRTTRGT